MAQLELAQQELTKVGAALMKAIKTGEAAQLQVMPILKQLKKVNTALTSVMMLSSLLTQSKNLLLLHAPHRVSVFRNKATMVLTLAALPIFLHQKTILTLLIGSQLSKNAIRLSLAALMLIWQQSQIQSLHLIRLVVWLTELKVAK